MLFVKIIGLHRTRKLFVKIKRERRTRMLFVEIMKAILLLIHKRAVPIFSLNHYLNHPREIHAKRVFAGRTSGYMSLTFDQFGG